MKGEDLWIWEWVDPSRGTFVQYLIESEGSLIGVCFDGTTSRSAKDLRSMREQAPTNPGDRPWRRIL